MSSDFQVLGGETTLRAIIDDFVDRCYADVMIGFQFQRASRDRIKEFEYQHAAAHLGAGIKYEGRALREAHGRHRIMGGQFDRRLQILKETLEAHEVAPEIANSWLELHRSLREHITAQGSGECR